MGRQREFSVDEALDAALRVFWQKGYEGASYDELTKATGVARPGLYAAFGNKESLFVKALDRYDAQYMAFMTDALKEPTARLVIQRILEDSAMVHTLDPDSPGCLGVNAALACSDAAEPIRQELIRRRKANEAKLRGRLRRARDEGDLPPSCDHKILAKVVMTVAQGMAVQAKAGATKSMLTGVVDYIMTTLPARSDADAGTTMSRFKRITSDRR